MRLLKIAVIAFTGALTTATANASIVGRQTLTACAVSCLATANLGGCTLQNYVCLCNSQAYIQSMTSCIDATCSSADIAAARAYSESICNSVGVSLVNSATVTGSSATHTADGNPSSTEPASKVPGSTSSSHPPIGAIVGGAVGGVVVLAALAVGLFFCLRRNRNKGQPQVAPQLAPQVIPYGGQEGPQMQSYPVATPYTPPVSNAAYTTPSNSLTPLSAPSPYIIALDSSDQTSTTTSGTKAPTTQLVCENPTTYSPPPPPAAYPITEAGMTPHQYQQMIRSSSPSTTSSPNGQLGTDQLVTLQSLYNSNMPATEIAGIMERMRAEQQASDDGSRSGIGHGYDPPNYSMPVPVPTGEKEMVGGEQLASAEGSSGIVRNDTRRDPPRYDFKDN